MYHNIPLPNYVNSSVRIRTYITSVLLCMQWPYTYYTVAVFPGLIPNAAHCKVNFAVSNTTRQGIGPGNTMSFRVHEMVLSGTFFSYLFSSQTLFQLFNDAC